MYHLVNTTSWDIAWKVARQAGGEGRGGHYLDSQPPIMLKSVLAYYNSWKWPYLGMGPPLIYILLWCSRIPYCPLLPIIPCKRSRYRCKKKKGGEQKKGPTYLEFPQLKTARLLVSAK